MESQQLFNVVIMAAGALGGWMLKVIWDAIRDLKREVSTINREVHADFVRREEFSDAIRRIETMCERIFDKLDSKADK